MKKYMVDYLDKLFKPLREFSGKQSPGWPESPQGRDVAAALGRYEKSLRRTCSGRFIKEQLAYMQPKVHETNENVKKLVALQEGKADKLRQMPRLAPVVILVCMERQKIEKIRELEEIEAVACAVQNMHLTATSRGLGAFWSTPPFLYKPEMNAYLGLGEKDRCLGIFYLGHPAEPEKWPKGRRQSIDDRIEFID